MIKQTLFSFAKIFWGITSNSHTLTPIKQKIYFANHSSHLDTITLLTSLPKNLKDVTRPVAAADYWGKNFLTRFISQNILNCVLIHRNKSESADKNPLDVVHKSLDNGFSVIIFPEGTRNYDDELKEFKPGIFHLYKKYPDMEFIPVYLNNLNRSMPKGQFIPVPLICTITFGQPLAIIEGETKENFLKRARQEVINLNPDIKKETK